MRASSLARFQTEVSTFLGWMEHRCVATVVLTENAPPGGERWRTPEGWHHSVHPLEAQTPTVQRLLCESYALEYRPHLATGVFGEDAYDGFIEACAQGPSQRRFPEQAVACGEPAWSDLERFMDTKIFVNHEVIRADDVALALQTTVQRPRFLYAGSDVRRVDGGHEIRGRTDRLDLLTVDGERSYALPEGYYQAWGADPTTGYVIERFVERFSAVDLATGEVTPIPVEWPQHTNIHSSDASATTEDWFVVGSPPNYDWPGELWAFPKAGGTALTVDAPAPPPGVLYSSIDGMWRDPRGLNQIVARVSFQDVYRDYDFSTVFVRDTKLMRIDLPSGASTVLQIPPDVRFWDIEGVLDDGRMVARIHLDEGVLVGLFDPDTGDLQVSSDVCATGTFFGLGDDVVVTTSRSDGETWEVYRP